MEIKISLTEKEAESLAQFLKRAGYSDYRAKSINDDEAYQMQYAGERVREALNEKGFAPR